MVAARVVDRQEWSTRSFLLVYFLVVLLYHGPNLLIRARYRVTFLE